jgi:DNA-binding beta-propeller fold protein YncE
MLQADLITANTIIGNPIPGGNVAAFVAFNSANGNVYVANSDDITIGHLAHITIGHFPNSGTSYSSPSYTTVDTTKTKYASGCCN